MFLCHSVPYPSSDFQASREDFTEIIPGEPLRRGLNEKGVAKYSDVGHVKGYISETVQDTALGTIKN